jgi:hypothetical protein
MMTFVAGRLASRVIHLLHQFLTLYHSHDLVEALNLVCRGDFFRKKWGLFPEVVILKVCPSIQDFNT